MSVNKWTKDEEIKFLKNISVGKKIDKIAMEHNRSVSAMYMRLKKIIHDNINSNKSFEQIAKVLNMQIDQVKQYYYEYKSFLENKSKKINTELHNIDGGNDNKTLNNNITKDPKKNNENNENKENNENLLKIYNKLKKIKAQNKILKEIVTNTELKDKIKDFYKQGKISSNIMNFLKLK